ncbi:MAG: FIST C-terminal domain-containing protein [Planctomycetes bacterium]|nr:FIST C-terminal domain-containing protein [Planctomycetota bacterium]
MTHVSTATELAAASGLSTHVDAVMAAEQVCESVSAGLNGARPDLALLFVSDRHVAKFNDVAAEVRRALGPGMLLGVSSNGVVGPDTEVENQPAVSLLALTLPNTTLHPFLYADLPFVGDEDPAALEKTARVIGAERDLRAVMFFGDPFSVPVNPLADALSRCHAAVPGLKRVPVIGGMASGARSPGANVIALNDRTMRAQGAGITVRGRVSVDTLVSQGCRPIGKPLVITDGARNAVRKLAGRPALEVLRATIDALPERDRELVSSSGVFVGRVINEYKDRFGRGDFLIRAIVGIDRNSGALGVNDNVRVGQTVQFHLRDANTAGEDLRLLLDAQKLQTPPVGSLLITCNGRGESLFKERHHDARTVSSALSFKHDEPMPMAGFFAAGEIGPIGDRSFVHGFTSVLAMFRPARQDPTG